MPSNIFDTRAGGQSLEGSYIRPLYMHMRGGYSGHSGYSHEPAIKGVSNL